MSSPAAPSPFGVPSSPGATDPGFDAVESLYRGATGRSLLRAYEPSLRPPEGTHDYGWLFRPDPPAVRPAGVLPGSAAPGLRTTTSGVAAVGDPLVRWSAGTRPAGRRWPAAALLLTAVGCALLLPWAVSAL